MRASRVELCANPNCKAEFKRLGTGKLYTFHIARSPASDRPANVKQKVVWLCSHCARTLEVEFDKQHCQVLLVRRERSHRQTA